jgi:hypothetical protein
MGLKSCGDAKVSLLVVMLRAFSPRDNGWEERPGAETGPTVWGRPVAGSGPTVAGAFRCGERGYSGSCVLEGVVSEGRDGGI